MTSPSLAARSTTTFLFSLGRFLFPSSVHGFLVHPSVYSCSRLPPRDAKWHTGDARRSCLVSLRDMKPATRHAVIVSISRLKRVERRAARTPATRRPALHNFKNDFGKSFFLSHYVFKCVLTMTICLLHARSIVARASMIDDSRHSTPLRVLEVSTFMAIRHHPIDGLRDTRTFTQL